MGEPVPTDDLPSGAAVPDADLPGTSSAPGGPSMVAAPSDMPPGPDATSTDRWSYLKDQWANDWENLKRSWGNPLQDIESLGIQNIPSHVEGFVSNFNLPTFLKGTAAGALSALAGATGESDQQISRRLSASGLARSTSENADVYGGGGIVGSAAGMPIPLGSAEGATAIESDHPLTEAAEAERSRLMAIESRASDVGYDLPEQGSAERFAGASRTNIPLVNAQMRQELGLPENSDLTPRLLDEARTYYSSPAYNAVRGIEEPIPLGDTYHSAIADAQVKNLNASPNERLPIPQGDSITGPEAVDFSQKARYLAGTLEKNPANPFARQDAQLYRDAADAMEDAVEQHLNMTGRPEMATAWDDARVYAAKSHTIEDALDGAGNVNPVQLKRMQLKGKYMSGAIDDVATLAAQNPDAFRVSRVTSARPSIVQRAVRGVAPIAGGTVGGVVAGPLGAGVGAAAAEHLADRIVGG